MRATTRHTRRQGRQGGGAAAVEVKRPAEQRREAAVPGALEGGQGGDVHEVYRRDEQAAEPSRCWEGGPLRLQAAGRQPGVDVRLRVGGGRLRPRGSVPHTELGEGSLPRMESVVVIGDATSALYIYYII